MKLLENYFIIWETLILISIYTGMLHEDWQHAYNRHIHK